MFKLTDKAKAFNHFIIQHTVSGSYNLSFYSSVEEAVECEAKDVGCSEEEIAATVKLYTQAEIIEAAADGYGWPLALSLIEEVVEEVVENTNQDTTMSNKMLEIQVVAENLEIHDSEEMAGEVAFTYDNCEYLLGDFTHTTEHDGWHGVMGLSYFSAYYVRIEGDCTVTLGYAHW